MKQPAAAPATSGLCKASILFLISGDFFYFFFEGLQRIGREDRMKLMIPTNGGKGVWFELGLYCEREKERGGGALFLLWLVEVLGASFSVIFLL